MSNKELSPKEKPKAESVSPIEPISRPSFLSQGDTGIQVPPNLNLSYQGIPNLSSFPTASLLLSSQPPYVMDENGIIGFSSQYGNMMGVSNSDITELKKELMEAKTQLEDSQKQIKTLQKEFTGDRSRKQIEALQTQISALATTLEATQSKLGQAQARSNDLVAPIIIPAIDDMKINLVPTNWLERLEEYRSDERIYSLLFGLFGGALLGMIAAWFANSQNSINAYAVAFLLVLVILTMACAIIFYRANQRAQGMRKKMLDINKPPSIVEKK